MTFEEGCFDDERPEKMNFEASDSLIVTPFSTQLQIGDNFGKARGKYDIF